MLGKLDARSRYYSYYRHDTRKIERIGKKYQWIAFYNILARISDTYLVKGWDEPSHVYAGSWEPYVRDFDPTLNKSFLVSSDAPVFSEKIENTAFLSQENSHSQEEICNWIQAEPESFASIPSELLIKDMSGCEWFVLYLYDDVENKPQVLDDYSTWTPKGTQKIWFFVKAFFVKKDQIDAVVEHVKSERFLSDSFPEESSVYSLFSREYAWSPAYKRVFAQEWVKYEIETGKYRIEKERINWPDFEHVSTDSEGNTIIPMVEKEFERRIPEDTINVEIMPAFSRVLWEEEYDASQNETTAFDIPCGDVIRQLRLEQKQSDGHYYSEDGTLVCFDSSLDSIGKGLLIRADYLKQYLQERDVRLLWTCTGEKQYFMGDHNQQWSNWMGYYLFKDEEISGEFKRYEREE